MISQFSGHPMSRRAALVVGSAGIASGMRSIESSGALAEDTPSAQARNRELIRRLFADGINPDDETLITTLYALIPVNDRAERRELPAVAGLPVSLQDFRRAVPNVQATVDALVAEADLVAARITWRASHPPAGTHIEGHTMHLFRIERDQIVEQWSAGWDWLESRGVSRLCKPANPLIAP